MFMGARQTAHRLRTLAAGGKRATFQFSPEEAAMLDRLSEQHGGDKPAVVAALRLMDGRGEITRDEVVAWIKRRPA
jgi:hypothetical protein